MRRISIIASIITLLLAVNAHAAAGLKYLDGDIISEDTVWDGYVTISGVIFLPAGVTLTIEPGTVVRFARSDAEYRESGLSEAVIPGSGLRVEGVVVAKGAREDWIEFTSAESAPEPGDWGCIYFDHAKGSTFEYCRFSYAQYTVHAHFSTFEVRRCEITGNVDGSRLGYSKALYSHCDIRDNTGKGLNFFNSRITVRYCDITGNYEGVFLNQKDEACVFESNNIHANERFDLSLGEFHDTDVTLSGNWWGTSDPEAVAGKIYDNADDPEIGTAIIQPLGSPSVGAGVNGLEAVENWRYGTGGFVDSSPAVSEGIVYFGSWDRSMYAVGARTGELVWKFETGDCVDSSPAVYDGKVWFGSWDRNIYCVNAETGREVWRFEMEPSEFDDHRQASPVVWERGRDLSPAVVMGGFNGSIYVLADGLSVSVAVTDGPVRSRPALVTHGRRARGPIYAKAYALVYAGSGDGGVYASELWDGGREVEPLWRFEAWGPVFSSPEVDSGRVYFGSRDGRLYCVDATDGKQVWSFMTGGGIEYSSPLLIDDTVIIGSTDGRLYAVDMATGGLEWSLDTGGVIYSSPVYTGGMVVTSNNAGKVLWLEPETGSVMAEFRAGGAVQALSSGVDGVVYAGSRDGNLYCLSVTE